MINKIVRLGDIYFLRVGYTMIPVSDIIEITFVDGKIPAIEIDTKNSESHTVTGVGATRLWDVLRMGATAAE